MLKIKNKYLYLLLPLFIIILHFLLPVKVRLDKLFPAGAGLIEKIKNGARNIAGLNNYVGEEITYDVKLGKLPLGKAYFHNLENSRLDGRPVNVMTMETKLTQFTDTEKIYSDADTLLPLRVERDVSKLLSREKITEAYDQKNFTVTIIKDKGGRQEKLVIKKDTHIHNALLLPYYVRRIPRLDVGRVIIANLPTRRLVVKLVSIEDVNVPAGTFKAYHFKSTPKQIQIWISTDERRIPIKIQGNGIFNYSMVMSKYASGRGK